jgi:hypothetical protein
MPRYFFHLTNGDSVADEVGEEFDVVEAARAHAIAVARELSGNRVPDDLVGCYISVVDERGVVVFKVPLYSIGPRLSKGGVGSPGCRTAWDAATFRACARACALVGASPRSMIFWSEITSQYQSPAEPFWEIL